MDIENLLSTVAPGVLSAGACVYMVIKLVPEERRAASQEREAARKDYLEALARMQESFTATLKHISDQDYEGRHEMANRVGALVMALYAKFGIEEPS